MIQLGDMMSGLLREEDELRDRAVMPAIRDPTTTLGEVAIIELLTAIHKRQRDAIMLNLRTR